MATYYVKTDGNDSLDGLSWANAWLTVNKAATTATGGDTVRYADGIYDLGTGQVVWNSGTGSNIIVHRADNWRAAIWEQSDTGNTVGLDTDSYISFEQLVIRGDNVHTQTTIVRMEDCDHLTFDDCELGESTEAGWGFYIRSCSILLIDRCKIHPNNIGSTLEMDGINVHYNCANITIRDTEVYHCAHEGIDIDTCDVALIDNCYVHHTGSHGICAGDSHDSAYTLDDITVRDCIIHDQDTTYQPGGGSYHFNLRVHRNASNVTLLRNECYNSACGGIYVSCTATGPLYIYNNTFHNNNLTETTAPAVLFDGSKSPDNLADNIYYKNNIIYVTQTGPWAFYADTSLESHIQADHNLYYSSSATKNIRRNGTTYTSFADYKAAGYEANAVIDDDPDFKDVGNANFAIWRWSPAINEGVDIGESFYGPAPDIGAHEHRRPVIVGAWT